MNSRRYWKNRLPFLLTNLVCMAALTVFLLVCGNSVSAVVLILIVWALILLTGLVLTYWKRKRQMKKLLDMAEQLSERYLISEVMELPEQAEDQVYYQLLKMAGKSMLEQIGEVERERLEYKEYIEQWIHEIKTPITAMKLLCENHRTDWTKELLLELEKTNRFTEQALYYARSEHTEKDYSVREMALSQVVHQAIADNKYLLLQGGMRLEVEEMQDTVYSDEKWVRFILNQLIANAVKYRTEQPVLRISTHKRQDQVVLVVEDNGIGIAASDLPRIFEKGFTGQNGRMVQQSTGIGLYLCKRLCEKLGIVEWFTKQGIEVWSVNEGQQRFDTHVDKLMNYIRYWQASGESLKTSVRTRTRLEQLTGEGHYTGGTVPFGYKRVRLGRVNKKNQEVCDLVIDEAEAEIVRLIFHKYVYEGYGAQKLSHYLYEQGVVGRNNKNIPNTSIVRMIKNKGYTGYLINGAVETECPQLRIIEPELFEQAQELRQARTCERGGTSLGTSSKALLTGLVYCGHCGNRLSLTSSGRTHTYADGHTVKEVRPRYSCFYKIRHPGDCDGQSGYGVSKLDSIVEEVVRQIFAQFREVSRKKLLESVKTNDAARIQKKIKKIQKDLEAKQKELDDLKAETILVIRGVSALDKELLGTLVAEAREALETLEKQLVQAQEEYEEATKTAKRSNYICNELFTWADVYDTANHDERRAILQQFIKEIRVRKDYEISITLNASFSQVEQLKAVSTYDGADIFEEISEKGA